MFHNSGSRATFGTPSRCCRENLKLPSYTCIPISRSVVLLSSSLRNALTRLLSTSFSTLSFSQQIASLNSNDDSLLLAIPSREQLHSMLSYMLDEDEFLSPYGIRSVSRYHENHPYELNLDGIAYKVDYVPGESNTCMFGGNSNWRGPIWHCSECCKQVIF